MLKRFFWLCSGSSSEVLSECSQSEQIKHAGIGGTIFFTAFMAAIAAGFALYTVFDNVYLSVAFGIVWGFLIFNLDRFIVSSMKKEGKWKRELFQAVPRILLAVIIAVVIAKPIELRIFEKEIDRVILTKKNEMTLQNQDEIAMQYQPQIQRLENGILGLQNEITQKEQEVNQLYDTFISEAEGTSGTGLVGKGPVYKEKREKYDQELEALSQLKTQNQEAVASLTHELQLTREALNTKLSETQPVIDSFDGLMARIEASNDLPVLPQIFIFLLFLAVETAPIFTKLISPRGEYDYRISDHDSTVSAWVKQKVAQRKELLQAELALNEQVYAGTAEEEELVMYKRQKARELLHFHTDAFLEEQKRAISNS